MQRLPFGAAFFIPRRFWSLGVSLIARQFCHNFPIVVSGPHPWLMGRSGPVIYQAILSNLLENPPALPVRQHTFDIFGRALYPPLTRLLICAGYIGPPFIDLKSRQRLRARARQRSRRNRSLASCGALLSARAVTPHQIFGISWTWTLTCSWSWTRTLTAFKESGCDLAPLKGL
jgi:hypothetical protein